MPSRMRTAMGQWRLGLQLCQTSMPTECSTVFETVFGPSPIRGKVRLPIGLQRLQNHCSAGPLLVGKGFAVSSLGDTCNARAASQASWPALTLTTTVVSAGGVKI